MKVVNTKKVIELAQEAGLIFNEHLWGENSRKIAHDWHVARLRKFAELLLEHEIEDSTDEPERA